MKEFIKKHWISLITILTSIIASVVINFLSSVSVFENIILGLIILLITTFIFDFDIQLDALSKKQGEFEFHLNPSAVTNFDSVDLCANEVFYLIKEGKHSVDFVSLDTMIRTQIKDTRRPMVKLLDTFVTNKDIRLRYVTSINSKNFFTILTFIKKSDEARKEAYYALCDSSIPFASFYIIDEEYLVIRTPYDSSVKKSYCLIKDSTIVSLFRSWFEMIWKNSNVLDKKIEIEMLYNSLFDEEKANLDDESKMLYDYVIEKMEV